MEWWTLLLVASFVISSLSLQTTRFPGGAESRPFPHIPGLAGEPQYTKTSAGGGATPHADDPGKIIAVVSESLVRFWSQELPQLLANKAATREPGMDGAMSSHAPQSGGIQCILDFAQLFQTYTGGPYNHSLGFQAIDAFGKPGSGVLEGNIYAYGSFDECFAIGEDKVQYLVAPVTVERNISLFGKNIPLLTFDMGMCVPQSCNGPDLEFFGNLINHKVLLPHTNNTYLIDINENLIVSTKSKHLPYSAGAIAMIAVCALFASFVFAATLVEVVLNCTLKISSPVKEDPEKLTEQSSLLDQAQHKRDSQQWKALDFIFAFSLFKNISMILATKQPSHAITSLNGIRVLNMFWVILSNTSFFVTVLGALKNPIVMISVLAKRFSFQAILNGLLPVDSFFFLSGTLTTFLTLREMEYRRRGWFLFITYYLHRYLRLTMHSYCFSTGS